MAEVTVDSGQGTVDSGQGTVDSGQAVDVNAAIEEARKEWEKSIETRLEDAKNEGARLAKLTAQQREEEETKLEREKFAKDKAEFERKTLIYETQRQLADKGLPVKLAEMAAGADAEQAKGFIKILEDEWTKGIEAAVTERLRGTPPPIGSADVSGSNGSVDFFDIIKQNQR